MPPAPPQTEPAAGAIRAMFARIARTYDLNNHLHSLGIDRLWRRAAVREAAPQPGQRALDAACGSGDVALRLARRGAVVTGVDFCGPMLAAARVRRGAERVEWLEADVHRLPLDDGSVDVATLAFGLRNLTDPAGALCELRRVLRPGGRLVVLEFLRPTGGLRRRLLDLWVQGVMPLSAGIIARDRQAYRYLARSIGSFADLDELTRLQAAAGLEVLRSRRLTAGLVGLTTARRPIRAD